MDFTGHRFFMKSPAVLLLSAFLIHCHTAPARQNDPEKELLRTRLVEAHVRILKLELDKARLAGKPEEELRILVEIGLASEFGEVRAAALLELGALPEERRKAAVPEVLKRFPSAPDAFKVQAIGFLGRVPGPDAEAAVLRAAADPSPAVRIAAASALKTSGQEDAVRTLLSLLRDPVAEVKMAALDALGMAKRETAVKPLLKFLASEKDDSLLEKAADALGAIGSPDAVDALLGLLRRTLRDSVRWSCINSLGKIGDVRAAASLRPYLEPAQSPAIREVTIEALGKMKDATALESLLEILRADREEKLRIRAAAALGRITPPSEMENLLLPAYEREQSPDVRRSLWESIKALTGEGFEPSERLVRTLLDRDLRAEAEEICTRLHSVKPEEQLVPRYLELEERVGRSALEAGDPKSALAHYRQALVHAPDRLEIHRKITTCFRELKDFDGAVKTLRDIEPKLPRGEAGWWAVRHDIVEILRLRGDAEPLLLEAHGLLQANPPPHPEDRKKYLEQVLREASLRLANLLDNPDEDARAAALEAVKRSGKILAPVLAAELEVATPPAPATLMQAASAITGTALDPAKPREAAAALRAWTAQPGR